MQWRLSIEEYGTELIYVRGKVNVFADALSRLTMKDDVIDNIEFISDQFGLDDKDLPRNMFLLKFKKLPNIKKKTRIS